MLETGLTLAAPDACKQASGIELTLTKALRARSACVSTWLGEGSNEHLSRMSYCATDPQGPLLTNDICPPF